MFQHKRCLASLAKILKIQPTHLLLYVNYTQFFRSVLFTWIKYIFWHKSFACIWCFCLNCDLLEICVPLFLSIGAGYSQIIYNASIRNNSPIKQVTVKFIFNQMETTSAKESALFFEGKFNLLRVWLSSESFHTFQRKLQLLNWHTVCITNYKMCYRASAHISFII